MFFNCGYFSGSIGSCCFIKKGNRVSGLTNLGSQSAVSPPVLSENCPDFSCLHVQDDIMAKIKIVSQPLPVMRPGSQLDIFFSQFRDIFYFDLIAYFYHFKENDIRLLCIYIL